MMETSIKFGILVSTTAVAVLVGFGLTLEGGLPDPAVPYGAVLITEEYAACDKAGVIEYYFRSYGDPGDTVGYLHTFGPYAIDKWNEYFGPPVFWIYYPRDGQHHTIWESTHRIVTLLGKPARYYHAVENLMEDYPRGICTVLRQTEFENEGGRKGYLNEVRALVADQTRGILGKGRL